MKEIRETYDTPRQLKKTPRPQNLGLFADADANFKADPAKTIDLSNLPPQSRNQQRPDMVAIYQHPPCERMHKNGRYV